MRLALPAAYRRLVLASALAATLLLVACNGGDRDAISTPPAPASPSPTTNDAPDTPAENASPVPDPQSATPTDDLSALSGEDTDPTNSDDPTPTVDEANDTDGPPASARLDLLIELTDPQDVDLLRRIGETVGQRRGLPLLEDVTAYLIRRDDIADFFDSFLEDDDRREADFIQTTYHLLGVFDADTKYLALLEDLYVGLVLGFYDFDLGAFVIVSSDDHITRRDIDTITHEFVHALQDQHFDLQATFDSFGSNSDQSLAYRFVIEGDARLAEQLLADLEAEVAGQLPLASDRLPGTSDRIPNLLQEIFNAPYREGVSAINTILNQADLDTINALLDTPPQSTEQLLHLDKLAVRELPITVSDPDVDILLGDGWSLIQRDTMGEFFVRLLIDEELSGRDAIDGAAGWGGDRLATYRSDAGDSLLVWNLHWDNAGEGDEFLAAMFTWLNRRSDGAATESADGAARTWTDDGRTYWIQGDGATTWITIGSDANVVLRVATALAG
jgi:hypothetical protein